VAQNLPLQCYCSPIYTTGCTSQDDINTFTLAGANSTSFNDLSTGCSAGAYDNRTAQPAVQLGQGTVYSGTISSNFSNQSMKAWIDFGDDGVFDATDAVGSFGTYGTTPLAYSITIPATATLGSHRMRIRGVYATTASSIDPCNSYTYGEVHDYTVIIIGNPLLIKLSNITATNVGSRNRIDWFTESEVSSDKFELERSADGRSFTYLATLNAKGIASAYTFWDEAPVTGINHYRLKMLDETGRFSYSKVVTANVKDGAFIVEAYPNPVKEILTVKIFGTAGHNPLLSISDVTGKVVMIVAVTNNEVTIDMSGVVQGMYLVKYSDNTQTQTIKVNKR
jgi:hypothetical protein